MAEKNESAADDRDPVIVWLEEIRDFAGTNTRSRELSQVAIDRLLSTTAAAPELPARPTGDQKIQNIVDAAAEETARGREARRKP